MHPTRNQPSHRARSGEAALAGALLMTALASCSGDTAPAASSAASSATSGSATGSTASRVTGADPASPFVVAASSVARRSREQVVELHAMGTSTTVANGVPKAELPRRGTAIGAALRQQIADATRLPPPAASPAARLVSALRGYAGLAAQLGSWNPAGAALPSEWFRTLSTTDVGWREAMRELSALSGKDLLAGLPTLALPTR